MEDISEKEQIELIREWWKENGKYVMAGIIIGVGGIFGFNQWKSSQLETRLSASTLFEALAEEVAENRLEPAEELAAEMYADYPDTIYYEQTRLAMAKLYMDQGRDEDAAATLRAMLTRDGDSDMQLVARLRLAKILQYQGKPDEVVALLDGYAESGFAPRFQEALGDAQTALGDYADAEASYLAALEHPLATQMVDVALLRMKVNDLPETLPEGESVTPAPAAESDVDAPPAEAGTAEPPAEGGTAETDDAESPETADADEADAEEVPE